MTTIRMILIREKLARIGNAIKRYFESEEPMGVTDWCAGIFVAFLFSHIIFYFILG